MTAQIDTLAPEGAGQSNTELLTDTSPTAAKTRSTELRLLIPQPVQWIWTLQPL
jgi:hypothetical protein